MTRSRALVAADLQRVRRLVGWREYPSTRTDEQVAALYRVALRETRCASLREFLVWRIGMRTAVAAILDLAGDGHPETGPFSHQPPTHG